jgi:dCMP deaminase
VGAVIVKNRQILATGYNGPPPSSPHCIEQGYCYPGLANCGDSRELPSRAIHAEANAIAHAAKYGVSVSGASIYVTKEPCLSCLKMIIAAGMPQVFYETPGNREDYSPVRDSFIADGLIVLTPLQLSQAALEKAVASIS